MQPNTPMTAHGTSTTLGLAQNRVLRNTYWLLALTMIPTVIGAVVGVNFPFAPIFKAYPETDFGGRSDSCE